VHELSDLSDTSYIIAGGKVAAAGKLNDLKGHQSEIVNQFLNGLPDGPVPFHYPAADYQQQLLADSE
jgi:phospholipid/cholesterol/gamma-HCH transport system ATP-binding protein